MKNKKGCFHNFGIDIFFDDKLKPWIIEANVYASGLISSEAKLEVLSDLGRDIGNITT